MVLLVWYAFVSSVCFLTFLLPYLAFERLVGWQPTHLALWLGVASLVPVAPAARGLLGAMHDVVVQREYPGAPARRFFRGVRAASRGLRQVWCAVPVGVLLLGYDVALYGSASLAVPILVALVGVAIAVLLVGASVLDVHGREAVGWPMTVHQTGAALGRRPVVVLAWVFLLVAGVVVTRLPSVGASLALFVPAAWAGAVDVVSHARRFGDGSGR
jgi:hypothetical protein